MRAICTSELTKSKDLSDNKEMKKFSSKHVLEFFKKAKPITAEKLHDYEQLDCHIRGTLKQGKNHYKFEIQPLGIGSLQSQESEKSELFGCKNCDELFPPQRE